MAEWLSGLLPSWARADNPMLQYELGRLRGRGGRGRAFASLLAAGLALGVGGYLSAGADVGGARNAGDMLWRVLYFPTLIVQVGAVVAALGMGIWSVESARSRRTWDHLRVTEAGAGLALRTRWVAIMYRLRAALLAIVLARVALILVMVYDAAAFDGRYVQALSGGFSLALPLSVLLMALSLLLPVAAIGAAAALGMLASVLVKERLYANAMLVILSFAIVALAGLGLFAVTGVLQGELALSDGLMTALVVGYSGFGDGGMLLVNWGSLGRVWAVGSPGLVAMGLGIVLMLQAGLIDMCLWLAGRAAERAE